MQSKQAVAPLSFMNLPALHLVHAPCLVEGCTVPGLQALALVEPVEHAEPAGHAAHCAACSKPLALLYRPSGHGSSADEPVGQ